MSATIEAQVFINYFGKHVSTLCEIPGQTVYPIKEIFADDLLKEFITPSVASSTAASAGNDHLQDQQYHGAAGGNYDHARLDRNNFHFAQNQSFGSRSTTAATGFAGQRANGPSSSTSSSSSYLTPLSKELRNIPRVAIESGAFSIEKFDAGLIVRTIEYIAREVERGEYVGAILIFVPGWREILDV
ncbi:unnamed protein product, partial [Amoebophrya sp. A25]|eukprot:GSA25T00021637001.1